MQFVNNAVQAAEQQLDMASLRGRFQLATEQRRRGLTATRLFQALANNNSADGLVFQNASLDDYDMHQEFHQVMNTNKSLRTLTLKNLSFTNGRHQLPSLIFCNRRNMETPNLSKVALNRNMCRMLGYMIRENTSLPRLNQNETLKYIEVVVRYSIAASEV